MQNVWIFQADRKLTYVEQQDVKELTKSFLGSWHAHGDKVHATAELRHDLFLIIKIDPHSILPTGCSIDEMVHFVKSLESKLSGISFFDRKRMAYRSGDTVEDCSIEDLKRKFQEGKINPNTPVFDTLITRRSTFEEAWERPLSDSWHLKLVN